MDGVECDPQAGMLIRGRAFAGLLTEHFITFPAGPDQAVKRRGNPGGGPDEKNDFQEVKQRPKMHFPPRSRVAETRALCGL